MRGIQAKTILYSSLAYFLGQLSILTPYVEVDTVHGKIRGVRTIARNGRPYIEFLNVPYARPPIGDLRFEPTQEPLPWKQVLDTTYYGNSCLQYEYLTHFLTGNEDCLHLNIYTHTVSDKMDQVDKELLKPVILFLHGGLFMSGFSYLYRGKYFLEEDVVLVVMNYRLNSFGFLNTGDGIIRGNMGLKDQVMGLRWINQNIRNFGGDPNCVTIMGQSAGGACVHYHMMSNMSKGLFHRAISMSGSALNEWAISRNPVIHAARLAKSVGCFNTNTTEMAKCLKNANAHKILKFHKEYLTPLGEPKFVFGPSIESIDDEQTFLSKDPLTIMKSGDFTYHVPWMTGITNGEGVLGSFYILQIPQKLEDLYERWDTITAKMFGYLNHKNQSQISAAAYQFYFGNSKPSLNGLSNLMRYFSDSGFYLSYHKVLSMHMRISKAPIYAYIYTYIGDSGVGNILSHMVGRIPRSLDFAIGASRLWYIKKVNAKKINIYGASHTDDLIPLFNIPILRDEITPGDLDYEFSHAFVKLFVSFASHGRPGNFFGVKWHPLTSGKNGTFSLFTLSEKPTFVFEPYYESLKFWEKIWNEYTFM